ncbi:FG-GAP repeat domain-containing protein [Streptomyces sp. NBC_00151]|uniref:FG-GAP repeat domain-containing protein n=1 Tax=Streptomyces sp. NBC_00151 TaxID=2975669 RepID=UPI002DDAF2FA|nr:VCBS repeat-containing protein [Streptomyces sp. NBC_00151]WRZ40892.1 VCBS repeat-containing protein [Streptomyces sp. NBC_00151]
MLRHAFVRRPRARRAAVAAAASALLAGGAIPLLPTSASAVGSAQETVVPSVHRSSYTTATLVNPDSTTGGDAVGVLGVFHRLEGHPGVVWTRYADGRSFDAPSTADALVTLGTGSDVLAYRYDGHVDLWNAVDSTTTTLHVPAGQTVYNVFGTTVVSYQDVTAEDGTTSKLKHLLTAGPDGTTRDVPVGEVPSGMVLGGPVRGDAAGLVFFARVDGAATLVDVDPETGRIRAWTAALPTTGSTYTKLSPRHLVVFGGVESTKAYVYSRSDLSAAPVEVTLDSTGSRTADDLAVVGDWLVHRPGSGAKVTAVPMAGGEAVTLFVASNSGVSAAPDGTAVVIGRTGADDWGVQRITEGVDGRPTVGMVKVLPKPPYKIQGLSLDQGRLLVADESSGGYRDDYVRTVAATGTPEFGERTSYDGTELKLYGCTAMGVGCSQLHGTADNRAVWLTKDTATSDRLRVNGPAPYGFWERGVPAGGQVTDVSGRYLIHTSATTQTVLKLDNDGTPALTRTPGAAALSGDVLWTPGPTPGTLTAYDLTAKKTTETLTTDAGCTPIELQALGRWIYWTCDGRAGVFDRTAKKSVTVPADEAKLGDGYVVTHDKAAGKLTLTAVAGGSAESRVIGDLPDTGVSQRDVRWTVDESGANAAYVDDQERVHLVPSGVAQQPLRLLAPAENASSVHAHTIDTTPDTLTNLLLSKPAANWTVTARNRATGKTYNDGRDSGPERGELNVGWFGDDPALTGDASAPDGTYDWTVSVTPADGVGGPLQVRGTVRLKGGSPVRHDHVGPDGEPDGTGDLLTLNSSGGLTFQQGDGKGAFAGKATGNDWSTKAVAVPFGDLNGDRCNDVLVRMSDGSLRGYKPACGTAPTPSTSYKALGTGWNAYDVLTSPGDLTGDRRPDLLARKASTGDLYLFAAKSDGTLAAGKKIRTAWTGYTKIVGAGDLNGDGIGDVLARDKAGTLYRYNGTGTGLLKDRVKVFSAWGASYNAIVGVGDITGDGKNDLVERDTSGNVYRSAGTGTGSFGSRVKIAGGWQGYKGLF